MGVSAMGVSEPIARSRGQGVGLSFASGFNSCFSDAVFVTLLSIAVGTAIGRE